VWNRIVQVTFSIREINLTSCSLYKLFVLFFLQSNLYTALSVWKQCFLWYSWTLHKILAGEIYAIVRRGVVISVLYITHYFRVKLIELYSAWCSLLDTKLFSNPSSLYWRSGTYGCRHEMLLRYFDTHKSFICVLVALNCYCQGNKLCNWN